MKIAHTADIHYEHTKNMPNLGMRHLNTSKIMDFMVERAIDEGVEAFLIAGDVFDTGKASHESVESFVDRIRPLADKKIPVVIIAGNHDVKRIPYGHRTPLHRLRDVSDFFYMMDKIGTVELPNGLKVTGFPWVSKKALIEGKGIDIMSDSLGEANNIVSELYSNILQEEVEIEEPNVLLGHFTVQDILPQYRGSEVDMMNDPWEHTFPASMLEEFGLKYIGLGHIHKASRVGENVYYPGSPERFTIKERNDPKGFNIVDLSKQTVEIIETPARKVVIIEALGDIEDNEAPLSEETTIVETRADSYSTLMSLDEALKPFPARLVSQRFTGDKLSSANLVTSEIEEIMVSPVEGMKAWLPEDAKERSEEIIKEFEKILVESE